MGAPVSNAGLLSLWVLRLWQRGLSLNTKCRTLVKIFNPVVSVSIIIIYIINLLDLYKSLFLTVQRLMSQRSLKKSFVFTDFSEKAQAKGPKVSLNKSLPFVQQVLLFNSPSSPFQTRVILPGEKALMVDRFNKKIIYAPYTNKHKLQIGEFGTQPPVAVA